MAASVLLAVEAALRIVFTRLKVSVDLLIPLQEPDTEGESSGFRRGNCQPDAVQPEYHGHDNEADSNQTQSPDK